MKSLILLTIILATAVGLVGVGLAQAPGQQAAQFRELFAQLDADRDGALERGEVPATSREAFDRLLKRGDGNHNGKLEAEEYRAVLEDLREFGQQAKKRANQRFRSMDQDGDGKLSRDEFKGPKPRFDVLDKDGDGVLTQQEFLGGAPAKAGGKAAAKKKANAAKKDD
jgi:Ca2+-binding EF-hand superfamily protein